MLDPDVLEILDDPEIGGGVPFQVRRKTETRVLGSTETTVETFDVTGSIQPQEKSNQSSTVEDLQTEIIVIRAAFQFQTGSNPGGKTFVQADEVLYRDTVWKVTRVDDWGDWGFTTAYATKDMG